MNTRHESKLVCDEIVKGYISFILSSLKLSLHTSFILDIRKLSLRSSTLKLSGIQICVAYNLIELRYKETDIKVGIVLG